MSDNVKVTIQIPTQEIALEVEQEDWNDFRSELSTGSQEQAREDLGGYCGPALSRLEIKRGAVGPDGTSVDLHAEHLNRPQARVSVHRMRGGGMACALLSRATARLGGVASKGLLRAT